MLVGRVGETRRIVEVLHIGNVSVEMRKEGHCTFWPYGVFLCCANWPYTRVINNTLLLLMYRLLEMLLNDNDL